MLPDPNHLPACFSELIVGILITFLISFDFCGPETGVRFGLSAMDGTTMPKAAIDENRYLFVSKHNVCSTAQVGQRLNVYFVGQSMGVESLTKRQNLRLSLGVEQPSYDCGQPGRRVEGLRVIYPEWSLS